MRTTVLFTLLVSAFLLLNCTKPGDADEPVNPVHCIGLITDTLGTNDNGRVYVQNAFSPNSDGLNDLSRVIVKNISSIAVTIYDANNNIVFSTTQLTPPDPNGFASTLAWTPGASPTYVTYYYKVQATTNSNHHIGVCGKLYKLNCFPSGIPQSTLFFESQFMLNGTYSANSGETMASCP